jgi:hypothetical protein
MTGRRGYAAAIAVGVAVAMAGCGGPMRQEELKRGIESLQSVAADGELLAHDVARDRTRATFVRVHARELAEEAQHQAEKLSDAEPGPGIGAEKASAVKLAQDISDALGELVTAPGDEAGGRSAEERLRGLAGDAERLAASF